MRGRRLTDNTWLKLGSLRARDPRIDSVALALVIFALLFTLFDRYTARSAEPEPLRIAVGLVPPYIDEDGDGTEAGRIRRLFSSVAVGREIEFHVHPFSRHWSAFVGDTRFGAVATVPESLRGLRGSRSEAYIVYQNGIGYSCEEFPNGFPDFSPADLAGLDVAGFAGASVILPGLAKAVESFKSYREPRNQRLQALHFLQRRIDIIIADQNILEHYINIVSVENKDEFEWRDPHELCFDPVFPRTDYSMVFRTDADRRSFDAALAAERF